MNIYLKLTIIVLLLSLSRSFIACESENPCSGLGDIEVSPWLQEQAQKSGFPYCSVMREALKGDSPSIAKLIRFAYKTDDDTAVEHGIAFAQLALELGDDYFLKFIQKQNVDQQLLAAKMLDAAMEFSDPILEIRAEMPKTARLLLSQ